MSGRPALAKRASREDDALHFLDVPQAACGMLRRPKWGLRPHRMPTGDPVFIEGAAGRFREMGSLA